jgi:hypothetical protein
MIKRFFFSAVISLFFAAHANAWDMDSYVENAQADEGIQADSTNKTSEIQTAQTDVSMVKTGEQKDSFKHHSISVTYGIITITDFAAAGASTAVSIFTLGNGDLSKSIPGAFSIEYGYKFNDVVESGLVFNYAHAIEDWSVYTIMPKIKLNLNYGGFVNPFVELDAGISIMDKGAIPMFHLTFLGLEIGRTFPLTLGLLSFGQRGIVYAGLGFHF